MKKTKLFLVAALGVTLHTNAQTLWNTSPSGVTTTTSGNCSIQGGLLDLSMAGDVPCNWRAMRGGTANGGLNLFCNTNFTDGALIQFWGKDMPVGCVGENRAGSIYYDAFYKGNGAPIGHRFMTYKDPATNPQGQGGFHSNFEIANDGRSIIGPDIDYSFMAPGDNLTVREQLGLYAPDHKSVYINGNAQNGGLRINATANDWSGPVFEMYGENGLRPGCIEFFSHGSGVASSYGTMFYNYDPTPAPGHADFSALMGITRDGRVVIGQSLLWAPTPSTKVPGTSDDYRLYVEKGILTEKLKVANSNDGANWSDFVFAKDYNLMPLSEVEDYVNTNKHLPEIPSAEEVSKEGIDVARMDAKLLQKIEELTLYVIEQNKKIESQQAQLTVQNDQIKKLLKKKTL